MDGLCDSVDFEALLGFMGENGFINSNNLSKTSEFDLGIALYSL